MINLKRPTKVFNFTKVMLLIGVVLFVFSGSLWWKKIYSNPENVFWGMIDNSLATNGVSRHQIRNNNGNVFDQTTQLSFGYQPSSMSRTAIKQKSQAREDSVTNETIGTTSQDFVRYASINTSQKSASGKDFDFSAVVGQWAEQETDKSTNSNGKFLEEALLNVVPFGNLKPEQRSRIISLLHEAYKVDFKSSKKITANGRPQLQMNVDLNSEKYTVALQELVKEMRLKFNDIDPQTYKNLPDTKLVFTIDIFSRQLKNVNFVQDGHNEIYSGYGITKKIALPKQTISFTDLQTRLQKIQ